MTSVKTILTNCSIEYQKSSYPGYSPYSSMSAIVEPVVVRKNLQMKAKFQKMTTHLYLRTYRLYLSFKYGLPAFRQYMDKACILSSMIMIETKVFNSIRNA